MLWCISADPIIIYVCTWILFLVLEILFYQVREWELVVEHFSCFPDWISSNRLKNKVMLCTFGIKKKHLLRFSMESKSINQVSVTVQFLVRSHWEKWVQEAVMLCCGHSFVLLSFLASPEWNSFVKCTSLPRDNTSQPIPIQKTHTWHACGSLCKKWLDHPPSPPYKPWQIHETDHNSGWGKQELNRTVEMAWKMP